MGVLKLFSSCNEKSTSPNPNKFNFEYEIIWDNWKKSTGYTLAIVNYSDCTTFDGRKLIIFKDDLPREEFDPHFLEDGNVIARFRPDIKGINLAIIFLNALTLEQTGKKL